MQALWGWCTSQQWLDVPPSVRVSHSQKNTLLVVLLMAKVTRMAGCACASTMALLLGPLPTADVFTLVTGRDCSVCCDEGPGGLVSASRRVSPSLQIPIQHLIVHDCCTLQDDVLLFGPLSAADVFTLVTGRDCSVCCDEDPGGVVSASRRVSPSLQTSANGHVSFACCLGYAPPLDLCLAADVLTQVTSRGAALSEVLYWTTSTSGHAAMCIVTAPCVGLCLLEQLAASAGRATRCLVRHGQI